jgi:hypothetical protein
MENEALEEQKLRNGRWGSIFQPGKHTLLSSILGDFGGNVKESSDKKFCRI